MKNFKNLLVVLLITVCTAPLLNSCGSNAAENDRLSGFMLGGIYFIEGYGGMENVVEILTVDEDRHSNDELIEGYKTLLEFPFVVSQKADTSSYLSQFWNITDKASLLAEVEALKSVEGEHKAWDYARSVNITCNGFAAEYLTEEEVLEITKEVLALARTKYDSWDAYYTDYNLGLKAWDAESQQAVSFGKLTNEILAHEKSIYNILPLK